MVDNDEIYRVVGSVLLRVAADLRKRADAVTAAHEAAYPGVTYTDEAVYRATRAVYTSIAEVLDARAEAIL